MLHQWGKIKFSSRNCQTILIRIVNYFVECFDFDFIHGFFTFRNMDTENQERKCWFLLTKQDDPTMWNQVRNSSKPSVWLLWRWLLTVCLDADALIKTLFPGLVLTPKMKISPGYEMTTNLRFHAVIGRHIILVVFIAETAVQV